MSGSGREEKPSSTSNFCCHYTGAAPRSASLQSGLPECPQSWRSVLSSINHQTLMTRNEWGVISGMYHSNGRSCNCDVRTHSGSWCKLGFLRNTILCIIIQLSQCFSPGFTCSAPLICSQHWPQHLNTVPTTQAKSNIQLLHSLNNDSYASLCVPWPGTSFTRNEIKDSQTFSNATAWPNAQVKVTHTHTHKQTRAKSSNDKRKSNKST